MKKDQTNERTKQDESQRPSRRGVEGISELFMVICMLSGATLSMQVLAADTICLWVAIFSGCVTALVKWLMQSHKRSLEQLKNVLYLAVVVSFVVMRTSIITGLLDGLNRLLILWNLRFGTEFTRFSVNGTAAIGEIWIWGVGAVIMTGFLMNQVRKHCFYGPVLCMAVSMYVNCVLGKEQLLAASYFLAVSTIGMLILYGTEGRRTRSRGCIHLALICLILAGIAWMCRMTYVPSATLEAWKNNVKDGIERFRYGEDTLPQGNLYKAAGLNDGDAVTLHVTMDAPQELYLRGFVGGTYQGTMWDELSETHYQNDYEGMLQWLVEQGLNPLTQYAKYDKLTRDATYDKEDLTSVKVSNEGASRKYIYMPDGVSSWKASSDKAKKDWQVRSKGVFGTDEYTFQMVNQMPTAEAAVDADWLADSTKDSQEKYLSAEAVYHSFVSDSYMNVPDSTKTLIQDTFFKDGTDEMNFSDVTRQIRQVLRDETVYNDTPDNMPEGQDMIRWFLNDYKQGNAVAYATTAVMAYRVAGYPARYVEGYHLDEETAKSMSDAGEDQIDLTASNAHAWAEVYVSGMGWLPVEVVPGMYVEAYTNQVVAGKPSYQVNASENQPGADNTPEESKETTPEEKKDPTTSESGIAIYASKGYTVVLIILYAVVLLYLILEVQRAVRLRIKRRKVQQYNAAELADSMSALNAYIYNTKGIQAEHMSPDEIWEQMEDQVPGLNRDEYLRVRELVQKVRFGGIELKPYEKRALTGLCRKLASRWYESCSPWQKLVGRYVYLIEQYER